MISNYFRSLQLCGMSSKSCQTEGRQPGKRKGARIPRERLRRRRRRRGGPGRRRRRPQKLLVSQDASAPKPISATLPNLQLSRRETFSRFLVPVHIAEWSTPTTLKVRCRSISTHPPNHAALSIISGVLCCSHSGGVFQTAFCNVARIAKDASEAAQCQNTASTQATHA